MSTTFFMSDAHLGSGDKNTGIQREKLLLDFFSHVEKEGQRLFIIGDLFDFWFEYRSVIPRHYFKILSAMKKLTDRKLKVHYILGNHDFGIDNFFSNELGVQIHNDSVDLNIESKRFHITHGDGLAKKDTGYRMLKKVLRHKTSIRLYRLLHPDIGFAIARFFSNLSRNYLGIKNRGEEYIQYAKDRFQQGFDAVVIGHTHQPQFFMENDKVYINTGDWMHYFTYGKFKNGRLTLEHWPK